MTTDDGLRLWIEHSSGIAYDPQVNDKYRQQALAALTERDILLKKLEVAGEEHDEIFAENVELKARLDTTQAKLDEANKHISTTSLERSLERARLAEFVRRAREILPVSNCLTFNQQIEFLGKARKLIRDLAESKDE